MRYEKEYFVRRQAELKESVNRLEKTNGLFSLVRLALFLLTAVMVVLAVVLEMQLLFISLAAVLLALFVFFCIKHNKVNRDLKLKRAVYDVNDEYIARVEGRFDKLKDKGSEFTVTDHDYCVDLDIFGDSSLFALYNISDNIFGRRAFKDELLFAHVSDRSNDEILKRQKAVSEFSDKIDFLELYQASSRLGKLDKVPAALISLASDKKISFSKKGRIIALLFLLLWLIPIGLAFVSLKLAGASILGIAIINLIVSFVLTSRYKECFDAVDGITRQTRALYTLYDMLEKEDIKEQYTKDLLKDVKTGGKVSEGLISLSKACSLCRLRSQPLLALVFNALFLFDTLCADRFVAWAEKYGPSLEGNLDNLGKIEALMSASVVEIISKESAVPEFVDAPLDSPENAYFKGEDIVHPLLDPQKAVSNSIVIDSKIALITGSNMSGKTTLIRTVGVNAILSYIGARVPGKSLKLGRMRITSSMRIVDSMKEEMSTFKAELVRISAIVEAGRQGKPMLFLIDEIFRGTNSADRTSGAMTVLKILSSDKIIGLMTTHDYALCDEAQKELGNVCYYHFSEKYDDEGISFDYKLKDGISNISNAKYLMKLVGIVI
ncbi:MAG: hypothetical protein K6F83_04495 [Clostridiales bacterium]|nr:hypothetical protein [Clostridiales bacterium]